MKIALLLLLHAALKSSLLDEIRKNVKSIAPQVSYCRSRLVGALIQRRPKQAPALLLPSLLSLHELVKSGSSDSDVPIFDLPVDGRQLFLLLLLAV